MGKEEVGFINKFNISRTDGTILPENAMFFVLRLDYHGNDIETEAAITACLKYARLIKNSVLERDIKAIAKRDNSMTEEERFEEWWKEFENTDGIVDFCNDQLKYVARKVWFAGEPKKINTVLVSNNPNMGKHIQEDIEILTQVIKENNVK